MDALSEVVADFDSSATAAGLSRDAALAQMQGSEFLDRRRMDMIATFARYDGLRADLAAVQGQGPFMRAYYAARLTDRQIAQAAWAAYQPAVPLNFAGISFALIGFVLGSTALGFVLRLLRWPLRRAKGA